MSEINLGNGARIDSDKLEKIVEKVVFEIYRNLPDEVGLDECVGVVAEELAKKVNESIECQRSDKLLEEVDETIIALCEEVRHYATDRDNCRIAAQGLAATVNAVAELVSSRDMISYHAQSE